MDDLLLRWQVERLLRKKNLLTSLTPRVRLVDDLGLDQLELAALLTDLEHRFGIDIPDERAARLRTVADVIRCVTSLRPSTAQAA